MGPTGWIYKGVLTQYSPATTFITHLQLFFCHLSNSRKDRTYSYPSFCLKNNHFPLVARQTNPEGFSEQVIIYIFFKGKKNNAMGLIPLLLSITYMSGEPQNKHEQYVFKTPAARGRYLPRCILAVLIDVSLRSLSRRVCSPPPAPISIFSS